jgi:hypothetical protein
MVQAGPASEARDRELIRNGRCGVRKVVALGLFLALAAVGCRQDATLNRKDTGQKRASPPPGGTAPVPEAVEPKTERGGVMGGKGGPGPAGGVPVTEDANKKGTDGTKQDNKKE